MPLLLLLNKEWNRQFATSKPPNDSETFDLNFHRSKKLMSSNNTKMQKVQISIWISVAVNRRTTSMDMIGLTKKSLEWQTVKGSKNVKDTNLTSLWITTLI